MNTDRKTTHLRALAATTAVAVALLMSVPSFAADATNDQTAAPAATPAPAPSADQATMTPTAHDAKVEARIKTLHKQLHITASQETQWTAVADVMRGNASEVGQLVKDRQTNSGTMTAVDDLKSYEAITDAHADGLKKLIPAFDALYASLSDQQKKTADQLFRHVRKPEMPHKA